MGGESAPSAIVDGAFALPVISTSRFRLWAPVGAIEPELDRHADLRPSFASGSSMRRTPSTWRSRPSPCGGNRAHPSASAAPTWSALRSPWPLSAGHTGNRPCGHAAFGMSCGVERPPWRDDFPQREVIRRVLLDAGANSSNPSSHLAAVRSDGWRVCARGAGANIAPPHRAALDRRGREPRGTS